MIKPIGQRVLVERVEAESKTAGGLFLPDSAKEKPQEAIVRALGTGGRDKDGKEIAFDVKAGDTVLLPKYGGTEVKLGDQKLQLVREEDLLGVFVK